MNARGTAAPDVKKTIYLIVHEVGDGVRGYKLRYFILVHDNYRKWWKVEGEGLSKGVCCVFSNRIRWHRKLASRANAIYQRTSNSGTSFHHLTYTIPFHIAKLRQEERKKMSYLLIIFLRYQHTCTFTKQSVRNFCYKIISFIVSLINDDRRYL